MEEQIFSENDLVTIFYPKDGGAIRYSSTEKGGALLMEFQKYIDLARSYGAPNEILHALGLLVLDRLPPNQAPDSSATNQQT
jgi:hypothetical protein